MPKPLVGILLGSDSDLTVMQEAARVLHDFGIAYDLTVASAHRTPEKVQKFVAQGPKRGIKVFIAAAGGAAHLPGVIAAMTTLPVIGVPIRTSTAAGVDSLFAIAQMPAGIPVATVAINGAKNAGILAAQILATGNKGLEKKMAAFKRQLAKQVMDKAAKLEAVGFEKYLKESGMIK